MVLYVDAAKTEGGTEVGSTCGKTAWRGVTDLDGVNEVFRSPSERGVFYEKGHNNPAEFCALIDGIRYMLERLDEIECVYTDSVTARSWVASGRAKCSIRDQLGEAFRREFEQREQWLVENSRRLSPAIKDRIRLWAKKTEHRENPADFGNK